MSSVTRALCCRARIYDEIMTVKKSCFIKMLSANTDDWRRSKTSLTPAGSGSSWFRESCQVLPYRPPKTLQIAIETCRLAINNESKLSGGGNKWMVEISREIDRSLICRQHTEQHNSMRYWESFLLTEEKWARPERTPFSTTQTGYDCFRSVTDPSASNVH